MADGAATVRRPRSQLVLAAAYAVLVVGYLSWALALPVALLTTAGHDDSLFWRGAQHIVDGQWLGPYDNLTLSKGPGFSLVLAANAAVGVPATLTLALLYVAACSAVVRQLWRLGLHRYAACVTFALVLFHPGVVPTRLTRDDIYPALVLIGMAGVLRVAITREARARSVASTACFGCALGLFWITREEGMWILPGLLLVVAWGLLTARRERSLLGRRLLQVTALFVAAAAVVAGVSTVNLAVYGRFQVTDFQDAGFTRVLKVLNGVQAGGDRPFVPVSEAQRRAIYAASPTFAELRQDLEDPDNTWRRSTCAHYPPACGDFAGGWWVWALRDAVAERGHYSSPGAASAFYDRISTEVTAACRSGSLRCRSNPIPYMPNVTRQQLHLVPRSVDRSLRLLTLRTPLPPAGPSLEPLEELRRFRDFAGGPVTTPTLSESRLVITGWSRPSAGRHMFLACSGGTSRQPLGSMTRLSGPGDATGVATRHPFRVRLPAGARCDVGSSGTDGAQPLPLAPTTLRFGDGSVAEVRSVAAVPRDPNPAQRLLSLLERIYGILLPVLALIGLVAVLAAVVLRASGRRPRNRLLWPAVALWVLVLSRVLVLVLVDVTSFSAINPNYMSAGFPLLVLAAVTALAAVADVVVPRGLGDDGSPTPRLRRSAGRSAR